MLATAALLAVLIMPATAIGQEARFRPQAPVIIQASDNSDACVSDGIVHGLDPSGDGFLAVKAGPGLRYNRIDKLYNVSRFISASRQAIGLESYTRRHAKTVTYQRRGPGHCLIPVRVAPDGSTRSGLS
jgi:hypothetical protein